MSVEVNIYTPSRQSRSAFLPSGFIGTSARPLAATTLRYRCTAPALIIYPHRVFLLLAMCCADLVLHRIYPGCSTRPKKEAFCPVQGATLSPVPPPFRRVATFHEERISIKQPLTVSDGYRYLILNRLWRNNDSPLHLHLLSSPVYPDNTDESYGRV